jgi:signal transduction histidine kinase
MTAIAFFYKLNYDSVLNNILEDSKISVDEISNSIDQHLVEKVKTTKSIAVTPIITKALTNSNKHYKSLSKKKRDEKISLQNKKWKTLKKQNDSFILEFTNNEVSKYFKDLQQNIKGEYGEIFLTNKYGALVASTAKLTTFAHAHKYWWQGSYDNGNGAVFLDDRGYDDSVGGYVLGVVVPVKKDNEIIGILKVNLNILGSINTIIVNSQIEDHEKLKLMRSSGLIIFEEDIDPLSKRISTELQKKIKRNTKESFIFEEKGNKFVIGLSEIKISSELRGYNFGGNFESIDHKKGNTGEFWYVLDMNPFVNVLEPINNMVKYLWLLGLLLSAIFAITSLIIGNKIAGPLRELIKNTEQIIKGDYNVRIITNRTDEIGELATSFNQMTNYLKESTTSIENLNSANQQLKTSEQQLEANNLKLDSSNERLKILNKIIRHDLSNDFVVIKSAVDIFKIKGNPSILDEINKRVLKSLETISDYKKYELFIESNSKLKIYELSRLINEVVIDFPKINFRIEGKCKVFADDALHSVFQNLINNSIKHGNASEIEILLSSDKNECKILFSDNGSGIPNKIQDKIFNEGYLYGKTGHTGIGLHIVKEVIERFGGSINVKDNQPTGAIFIINLRKAF